MSIEAELNAIIAKLEGAREDAQKCDKGKAGAPGTRLRACAEEAKKDLQGLKKAVLEVRKS
jgi:hypothetical protein